MHEITFRQDASLTVKYLCSDFCWYHSLARTDVDFVEFESCYPQNTDWVLEYV